MRSTHAIVTFTLFSICSALPFFPLKIMHFLSNGFLLGSSVRIVVLHLVCKFHKIYHFTTFRAKRATFFLTKRFISIVGASNQYGSNMSIQYGSKCQNNVGPKCQNIVGSKLSNQCGSTYKNNMVQNVKIDWVQNCQINMSHDVKNTYYYGFKMSN